MAVTVRIPTQLRPLTGGAGEVPAEGGTVAQVLADLNGRYEGLQSRLFDDGGSLRRFVNVYVNDEDIRFDGGLDAPVQPDATISIIPAVAGG